jgi:hypothetical protein
MTDERFKFQIIHCDRPMEIIRREKHPRLALTELRALECPSCHHILQVSAPLPDADPTDMEEL